MPFNRSPVLDVCYTITENKSTGISCVISGRLFWFRGRLRPSRGCRDPIVFSLPSQEPAGVSARIAWPLMRRDEPFTNCFICAFVDAWVHNPKGWSFVPFEVFCVASNFLSEMACLHSLVVVCRVMLWSHVLSNSFKLGGGGYFSFTDSHPV